MIQFKLNEKPLSVNEAWQGKRFKTEAYKHYERTISFMLPKAEINPNQMLRIEFFFGFSNKASDLDNPVKLLIDIRNKCHYNTQHNYLNSIYIKEKHERLS